MSFTDIFKKGFLTETDKLTTSGFVMSMLMAFICGMVIYCIYKYFFKGVIYNNNFNILLVMTTMITCFIVIVISSNVVLSLGMVGALSIVRFRTAVKDPLDVGFIFWSVAAGITSGAGLYLISIYATVAISVVYILLVKIRTHKRVYLLIIKHDKDVAADVAKVLASTKKVLKNKTVTRNYIEVTYELKVNVENTLFVNNLLDIEKVESAVLVEFTGDYCG